MGARQEELAVNVVETAGEHVQKPGDEPLPLNAESADQSEWEYQCSVQEELVNSCVRPVTTLCGLSMMYNMSIVILGDEPAYVPKRTGECFAEAFTFLLCSLIWSKKIAFVHRPSFVHFAILLNIVSIMWMEPWLGAHHFQREMLDGTSTLNWDALLASNLTQVDKDAFQKEWIHLTVINDYIFSFCVEPTLAALLFSVSCTSKTNALLFFIATYVAAVGSLFLLPIGASTLFKSCLLLGMIFLFCFTLAVALDRARRDHWAKTQAIIQQGLCMGVHSVEYMSARVSIPALLERSSLRILYPA